VVVSRPLAWGPVEDELIALKRKKKTIRYFITTP
jgi:hypothetical protein